MEDFPRSYEDFKSLIKGGFHSINGAYIVEEVFNRDIEDESDDDTKPQIVPPKDDLPVPTDENKEEEE